MSLPRPIVKGRVYMITRRCSERRFFMRPSRQTNNAFKYCLGVAAQRHNIGVIFTVAMSNHHHTGIIDRDGRLPEFLAYFHRLFARHQNVLRGRWENFWALEQTSAVELVTPDDIIEKMVYALTNPVKAHLVEKTRQWPGVTCLKALEQAKPLTASKPARFFRRDNDQLPSRVSLELVTPPGLEHLDRKEWLDSLLARLASIERDAGAERAAQGTRVAGRHNVRKQSWRGRPKTDEPKGTLNPRVASKSKWRLIEVLRRNREFIHAYKQARSLFMAGLPALFPAGTYWLRIHASATCEPFPAPS
jgi:putative transposase